LAQATGVRKLFPAHGSSNAIPYDQVSAALYFGGQLHCLQDFFGAEAGRRSLFMVMLKARDAVRGCGGPQADQKRGLFVHGSSPPLSDHFTIRRKRPLKGYNQAPPTFLPLDGGRQGGGDRNLIHEPKGEFAVEIIE